jgi:hypothetical protein
MRDLEEETLTFLLKFIFELTIVRRHAVSRDVSIDTKIFQLIHTTSSCGMSGKDADGLLAILQEYSESNPDMRKIIEFALDRAKP